MTSAVDRFLTAVENATIPDCDVWHADAVLDATVPNWRFHRRGPAEIRREYARWFADPGTFEELQRRPLEDGEVVRYLLCWTEHGVPHAAHHVHVLHVAENSIVRDTVVCGGRWPASLLAEIEAADS
jgi:hypothetical protein